MMLIYDDIITKLEIEKKVFLQKINICKKENNLIMMKNVET